jgi:hypothetical protein
MTGLFDKDIYYTSLPCHSTKLATEVSIWLFSPKMQAYDLQINLLGPMLENIDFFYHKTWKEQTGPI